MYKYINPNNRHLQEIMEYGENMVIEIIDMMPEEYQKHVEEIRRGIATKQYSDITIGVHSIKANLRYFIEIQHPVIQFCQDFENRSRALQDEMKDTGSVKEHVDFTADFEKLLEITEEPLQEIQLFGFELKEKTGE
jgi:HPt (histidine-containing phosphotransfer) domain-containing protein